MSTADHETMSLDAFRANEATILADVCAILNGELKVRKRLRLCRGAVYERGGDNRQLVAELLRTSKGPVVVYRRAAIEDSSNTGSETWVDIREFRREQAVAPFTGDPDQRFAVKGERAIYLVLGANFIARAYPERQLIFE